MRKYMTALIFVVLLSLNTSFVFAAANPNIIIVNPVSGSTVYSDNLLVSVKITTPSSIKVSVTQEFKLTNGERAAVSLEEYQKAEAATVTGSAIGTADNFTSTTNLSFYTKKIDNVNPGVYKITVDTLSPDGVVLFTNSSPVEIKAKESNAAESAGSESNQSGAANFLRSLLKIIFN